MKRLHPRNKLATYLTVASTATGLLLFLITKNIFFITLGFIVGLSILKEAYRKAKPSKQNRKDPASLWLGLLMVAGVTLFVLWPNGKTLWGYKLLQDGRESNLTVATIDLNSDEQQSFLSYKIAYHYFAGNKRYEDGASFDNNDLFLTKPPTLGLRYLVDDPKVHKLELGKYGQKFESSNTPNQEVNAWMMLFVGYFGLLFGIGNIFAGLGVFPSSWLWGDKVNKFGFWGCIILIISSVILLALTALLIVDF
jgi:hypothetical protein